MSEQVKPTVGRIVNYYPSKNDPNHNSAEVLPAIIVRVWSNEVVNLKVINDGEVDFWKTSVALLPEDTFNPNGSMWSWPVRN